MTKRGARMRTAQRQEAVLNALRGGATRTMAAIHGGMSYESLRLWMVDSPAMRQLVEEAENAWSLSLVASLTRQSRLDANVAMKLLERHPSTREQWAPNATPAVSIDARQVHLTTPQLAGGESPPMLTDGQPVGTMSPQQRRRELGLTLDVLARAMVINTPDRVMAGAPVFVADEVVPVDLDEVAAEFVEVDDDA